MSKHKFKAYVFLASEATNRCQSIKAAFEASRSPWCYILDSDDFVQENAIPYAHWVLHRFPQFKVFCSNHAHIDEQGEVIALTTYDPHEQRAEAMALGFKQRHLWGFHRDIVTQIPNILDSPYICEDVWFFSRLTLHSEAVMHIPKVLYFWRRHPLQMTQVYAQDIEVMNEAIRLEIHRWMCGRPIGANFAEQVMAERITRTAQNLLR